MRIFPTRAACLASSWIKSIISLHLTLTLSSLSFPHCFRLGPFRAIFHATFFRPEAFRPKRPHSNNQLSITALPKQVPVFVNTFPSPRETKSVVPVSILASREGKKKVALCCKTVLPFHVLMPLSLAKMVS